MFKQQREYRVQYKLLWNWINKFFYKCYDYFVKSDDFKRLRRKMWRQFKLLFLKNYYTALSYFTVNHSKYISKLQDLRKQFSK